MADEINVDEQPPVEPNTEATEQQVVSKEPEYTEAEQQALAQGWVPKDQYTGSGKWRDAEEFLDRGELFAKIDEQNRKLRNTESTLEELKKHYRKVAETEYKRALADLKNQKKEALNEGNADLVIEIDEQIDATKTEAAGALRQIDAKMQQQEAPPNPAFVAWVNRNPWYQTDVAMKIYADTIGAELHAKGMYNPTEILAEVERRTKKEFVQKFTNPNRGRPGAVEGSTTRSGNSRGTDSFQLTPEETQVMNKLVRHKVMTKEEYIADIKAERGV